MHAARDDVTGALELPEYACPWGMPADRVLAALRSAPEGLAEAEAETRLAACGPNALEEERAVHAWTILLRQFRSPLIYILLLAAAVTVALNEPASGRRPRQS